MPREDGRGHRERGEGHRTEDTGHLCHCHTVQQSMSLSGPHSSLSTSQEGWSSWCCLPVFTEHPQGAEGLWGGQTSKDFSRKSGTWQGTDPRGRSRCCRLGMTGGRASLGNQDGLPWMSRGWPVGPKEGAVWVDQSMTPSKTL